MPISFFQEILDILDPSLHRETILQNSDAISGMKESIIIQGVCKLNKSVIWVWKVLTGNWSKMWK